MIAAPPSGVAFVLRLDAVSAERVAALADPLGPRPWPPHVTLAVMDESSPELPLLAEAMRFAAAWTALPVTLASLGIFPGPVSYLAPVPTEELMARRTALVEALGGAAPLHPHSRPGAWVPHVTLGSGLVPILPALAALPLTVTLDRLELVRFPPAQALFAAPLALPG